MYNQAELRAICKEIVSKSKGQANVDTGRLKRSISFVFDLNDVPTFTETFYGQFGDNSELEENIKTMMPSGVAWRLIYTDDNGAPYEVVKKLASGRVAQSTATKATTRKSLGIDGIKNFLKKFTDGKKNKNADSERPDNKEES